MKNNKTNSRLILWSGMIGNSLDHYDVALYTFLIPIIAPLFFPNTDPVISLIYAFGAKSTLMIAKPIGSLIFGNLTFRYPVKNLLIITLTGVGISTFFMGFIPSYKDIGIAAPLLLVFVRTLQGIFAGGESTIATIFVLEQVKDKTKISKNSSIYLFSTMCGPLLASGAAVLVNKSSDPHIYWRYAFQIGIATSLVGIILRLIIKYPREQINSTSPFKMSNILKLILKNKPIFCKIIIISSFSYITYILPFVFLNNFIPLISTVKVDDLIIHTTILIVINNALIPVIMLFIDKFNIIKWMALMSGLFSITIIPIFLSLPYLNICGINITKLWIIILGVCFSATFSALLFKMGKGPEKYLVTGFGYALGSEVLGRNTSIICISLWYYFGNLLMPGIYLSMISCLTTYILIKEYRSNNFDNSNIPL